MATITDNINRIKQAKADIKEAIISKGVEVSDDVRIDDYAAKISEIQQGGGGSQFAIDFGEEIASGNPAFIGALQEDIDYYNEVVRSIESGERTQDNYLSSANEFGKEFRRKIAWWPKNFTKYSSVISKSYTNLKEFNRPDIKIYNGYYAFKDNGSMQSCVADFSKLNSAKWMFENCSSLRSIDLQNAPITNADNIFKNCYNLRKIEGLDLSNVTSALNMFFGCYSLTGKIEIILPNATNAGSILEGSYMLEEAVVDIPKMYLLNYSLRGLVSLRKLTINMPKVTTNSVFLYESVKVEELYISGLQASTNLNDKPRITTDSVKYILGNCQARADGAAYTLTLHANVKAAFMAKCTEGDENYDAEYAATLAAANAKGLTIA